MNIEDIRLTEEEMIEVNKERKIPMPGIVTDEERFIANTATDEAIKKIVEELKPSLDAFGLLDFDFVDTADTIKLIQSLLYRWEALKKLVEGG